jgi:ASC-1-like (ASCH) protein
MNLWNNSFDAIKQRTKTVEMRLYDEKRKFIKCGDTIVFINTSTKEELAVIVKDIKVYRDFEELYKHYAKTEIGYLETETANSNDLFEYYSKDQIDKYGACAIEISFE